VFHADGLTEQMETLARSKRSNWWAGGVVKKEKLVLTGLSLQGSEKFEDR
jgi:hypothetical protein